ncbi:MAG: hypothetical protein Fur005_21870 [Roseiflexaceae bacterium]
MREAVSSILKLGLINSGMFDTLELNTDVRAVHLVGDNNVGKTSLIELIQFLYFPDLREMHFSKSLPETLAFYFRREGSYVLFTVRTVRGTQRTLGVYGTGSADSRQVFAFDGAFTLADFLDEQSYVLPPARVGVRLADRRFYIFPRAEDHERSLVGEQSEDQANVHLFDLGRSNFRLLRRLLQNLLRLERLTARDIRLFFNALVESTGAKTRIDVARDFDRKYAETRSIRERINSLLRLKPLIDQWTAANERFEQATAADQAARLRLSYAAQRYAGLLEEQQRELSGRAAAIGVALAELEEQRQQLANQIAEQRSHVGELQRTIAELQRLTERCVGRRREEVRAERDQLSYEATDLQKRIEQAGSVSVAQIKGRLRKAREDRDRIRRLIESRTVSHLLAETDLSDEQRALLHFLFSEQLLSLPLASTVADAEQLLAFARAATAQIDSQGVFYGFGFSITRSVWYRPAADEEPLADWLAEAEQRILAHERELTIARDREQVQQQIRFLHRQANECEALLSAFQRLEELEASSGGAAAAARELEACRRQQQELEARQLSLQAQVRRYQTEQVDIQASQRELQQRLDEVRQVGREIGDPIEPCPADIAGLAADELPELFRLSRERHRDQRGERRRAEEALHEPRSRLDDLYEREAPETPFAAWVDEKRLLTAEVERLEAQLRESYTNLVTLVKGELDKLTQAFEVVRSRVADLNNSIRRVSISNIERIELQVQESQLVEAIRQTSRLQLDMFVPSTGSLSLEMADQQIEEYLVGTLRAHGRELNLDDLFQLEFRVTYAQTGEQRTVAEIHAFESNGTAIGVKIVVYLGLIRLLQGSRRGIITRIPFFLDEVGSLSSNNVRQIIAYCTEHNFLPIFASPTIRSDIPHSYILQRDGDRSRLVNEVILTDREHTDEATHMDSAAR